MPIREATEYYKEQRANTTFRRSAPESVVAPDIGVGTIFERAGEESFMGQVGSTLAEGLYWNSAPQDPEFDAYDMIIRDGMQGYADDLYGARSQEEYDAIKSKIDRSKENKEILANGGVPAITAQFAWGTLDPVNLAPVLGASVRAYKGTKSLAAAAGAAAAVGGASQAAQELVLSEIDPTYNPSAGQMAIGANMVLSGILGPAVVASMSPALRARFKVGFDDWQKTTSEIGDDGFWQSSTGAARVGDAVTFESLEPMTSLGTGRLSQFISPQTRLQASPSMASRKYNAMINETPLMTKGNMEGLTSVVPIEAEKRAYFAMESNTRQATHDAYLAYREAMTGKKGFGVTNDIRDVTGASARAGILTRQEFYDRIGMSMRRGDRAEFTDFPEANPFIARAAGDNRKLFNTVLKQMIDSGAFKDVPDLQGTAESWFMRIYNRDKIVSDPAPLQAGLVRFYKQQRDLDIARLPQLEEELRRLKDGAKKIDMADKETAKASKQQIEELTSLVEKARMSAKALDEELETTALKTIDRIKGSPLGLVEYDELSRSAQSGMKLDPGMRGTKERKLKIPDTYEWDYNGVHYKFEDFLHSDPTMTQAAVMRSVVPDMLIYNKFGTLDTQKILTDVSDDYSRLAAKAKTAKERTALEKRKTQDLEDIRDSLAILRGTFANYDDYYKAVPTGMRMMRQANYLSKMGEAAIASAADVGLLVNEYGMRKVFGRALPAFVKSMRSEVLNMALEDAQKFVVGVETVMGDRFAKMYDADVFAPVANRVEGALNYMSHLQQNISLMNTWLDALRPLAAVLEQDRIVTLAQKVASGQSLSKIEVAEMSAKFLNKDDLLVIADQFSKHGTVEGGAIGGRLLVPNALKWDIADPKVAAVRDRLRTSVAKTVDEIVIKPGSGVPKSTKKGGVVTSIFQFKSFMFDATGKVLVKNSQRLAMGDKRLILGMSTMVALGMVSYALKAKIAGRDLSENPSDWLAEGIDRSGILGIFGEINNTTEKLTGNRIGMRPLVGAEPASRYMSRNALETLFGPSTGIIQDAWELGQSYSVHGNLTQGDLNKIRRQIPFQNSLGLRYLYDGIVEGVSDTLDLPEKR